VATWQVQTAKAKLSELLRAVRDEGPQTISVRGREEFVVMRKEDAGLKATAKTWDELYELAQGAGEDLVLPPRDPEPMRAFQLGEDRGEYDDEER
jgi:prevent-host-death family protein